MDLNLIHEIEQFLYYEARLLDDLDFDRWLELLTDDIRYWMPLRHSTYENKIVHELVHGEDGLSFLDETKDTLVKRIERRATGKAFAEQPPSRTRHFITNIEVQPGDNENEYKVYSNVLVYRSRSEKDEDYFIGKREDILRRVDGNFKLAYRKIVLEQNVLLVRNISVFL